MEWKNRVKEEIQGEIINTVSFFFKNIWNPATVFLIYIHIKRNLNRVII